VPQGIFFIFYFVVVVVVLFLGRRGMEMEKHAWIAVGIVGERHDDGDEDTTSSGSGGGHSGRQRCFRKAQPVRQPQRCLAQEVHANIGNAVSQARLVYGLPTANSPLVIFSDAAFPGSIFALLRLPSVALPPIIRQNPPLVIVPDPDL
jgi:hypothetical protein